MIEAKTRNSLYLGLGKTGKARYSSDKKSWKKTIRYHCNECGVASL